jgi:superfamily II DNA/RNA helicase
MNTDFIVNRTLQATGFQKLNDMQKQMLETAVSGTDCLLLSPTGSGKTLAFLLPLWQMIETKPSEERVLIVVPARELAEQIADVWQRLHTGRRVICCYGGHDLRTEAQDLSSLPPYSILVGTPGRLLDHADRGHFQPETITRLVLDEYDKILELGFEEEMKALVGKLSGILQRILTSATHNMPIAPWLGMKNWKQIDFESKTEATTDTRTPKFTFRLVKSPIADKLETLHDLLCTLEDGSKAIVFSNYRESSERIAHFLIDHGIACALYHGGLEQPQRDKAMIRFRNQSIRVLVSTDLASRGLDIPEVDYIIHYHLPSSEEAYTHRNGRTARAGAEGSVCFILGPDEQLPAYVNEKPVYFNLRPRDWKRAEWDTIYIGRGKREKISRGDVLGFFSRNGGIDGSQIGRIDVLDHCAFCAIRSEVADDVLSKVRGLKIKGEKTHYLKITEA